MGSCCSPLSRGRGDGHTDSRPERLVGALESVTSGMVLVRSSIFRMGNGDDRANRGDGEGPVRDVHVSNFLIDPTCVTNEQFSVFVSASGYVTDAERFGWSYVFHSYVAQSAKSFILPSVIESAPWWAAVRGASWETPEGPGSSIEGRHDHPVVHISWHDAQAYAAWAQKRLPAEAEWEKAARGGRHGARYPWGNQLRPKGEYRANIWQGRFPVNNTAADGYHTTAPVRSFPPNGFGLFNVAGNVWEWCEDWWSTTWHRPATPATRIDPAGPDKGSSRVMRGGSYLCHSSYCDRYRVGARTCNTPDSSAGNLGFRCAADVELRN